MAVKKEETTFISRITNQIVCIVPDRVEVHNGVPIPVKGSQAEFSANRYMTSDDKVIEFLEKHENYGVDWWKLSKETVALVNEKKKEIISE